MNVAPSGLNRVACLANDTSSREKLRDVCTSALS
jgi:hypothetical protein